MGVVATLRHWSGEPIQGLADPNGGTFDGAGDFDRLLPPPDDRTFAVLRFVDTEGALAVNRLQAPDLIADIDRLLALQPHPLEERGLRRLRAIAERCASSLDVLIWFEGD